ncbi:MAG: hypothetical protein DI584_01210 [Stenotrophomonas sp.]|nr:MAG: hypothetical protein DI584_01210 [Stenotrophomonas sp.]
MTNSASRIAGLDGLRALSVLVVFAHHTGLTIVHGGFIGVDIFFVLSGFLITRLLSAEFQRSGRISLRIFYAKRSLRLYPALILLLLGVTIYWLLFKPRIHIEWEIFPALLYTMNWIRAFDIYDAPMTGHTWSLAIEEQFYIIWPLAILALFKVRSIKPAWIVLAGALGIMLWRSYLGQSGASSARIYTGLDTHSDGLLIGAFIALAPAGVVNAFTYMWKPAATYLITCAIYQPASNFASTPAGFAFTALSAGAIIAKISLDQDSTLVHVLSDRMLAWLGTISYGFYLWHYPVIYVLLYAGNESLGSFFGSFTYPRLVMFAACLLVSLLFTVASWKLVESPILKWGHARISQYLGKRTARSAAAPLSGSNQPVN